MSQIIQELVELLEANESSIDFNYKGREDLIAINKELKDKLFDYLQTNQQAQMHKEFIKSALREALELEESDIIIIKADEIVIKLFDYVAKKEIGQEDKNTIAERFNGIDEEELNAFYNDYFLPEKSDDFFARVATLFIERYFNEQKIDNAIYEKHVFSYIQMIFVELFQELYDDNEAFFIGFAGFVFRKHFEEVFSYLSDGILFEIVHANKHITEFLKYYSFNVVIVNGVKYKVPHLEASDGLRWNVISMMSVVKVYVNAQEKKRYLKEALDKIDDKVDELYIGEHSPVEYNEIFNKEKQKLDDALAKQKEKIQKYYDAYRVEKDEQKVHKISLDIEKIRREREILTERKENFMRKALAKNILKEYINLEKEYETLSRELKREQRLLDQNETSYLSIKSALTRALISKKQTL
jgi:hypothetical protein